MWKFWRRDKRARIEITFNGGDVACVGEIPRRASTLAAGVDIYGREELVVPTAAEFSCMLRVPGEQAAYRSDPSSGLVWRMAQDHDGLVEDYTGTFTHHGWMIENRHRRIIDTGLVLSMPPDFEAQVRSRSGLAAKHGVVVLNSPGTIDADYTGTVRVILQNHSDTRFFLRRNVAIAQLVFARVEPVHIHCRILVTKASDFVRQIIAVRGTSGFGSTDMTTTGSDPAAVELVRRLDKAIQSAKANKVKAT